MSEITIRPIEISDLDEFKWTGGQTHIEYFKDALKKSVDGGVLFLGAWKDTLAVGRCGIDFEKNPGKATLWMFNVKEGLQGQGIGTLIMKDAEKVIAEKDIDEVVLNVEKDNSRAKDLYIKRGYVATGEGEESWEEDGPNGTAVTYHAEVIHMSKSLGNEDV